MGDVVSIGDRGSPPKSSATHDYEAEQSLLGALLAKSALLDALPDGFDARHFRHADHAEIYALLRASDRTPASATEVVRRWSGEDAARRDYASRLYTAVVDYSAERQHGLALQLVELHRRRDLIAACNRAIDTVNADGREVSSIVAAMLESEIERIGAGAAAGRAPITIGDAALAALEAGERARAAGGATGLRTGFSALDGHLVGLEGGALYVLGARPGMGKTALALQIALNIAKAGSGVLFVSLEMQAVQLARRALALASGVPLRALRTGALTGSEGHLAAVAAQRLAALPLHIEEEGGLTVDHVALRARAAHRRHGIGLVIVDHLHIVGAPDGATRMGATWAIGAVSNGLKRLAKTLDVPVLALAQLNRGVESREDKRPNLSDLRQSGDIEQDAEAVVFLHRPEMFLSKDPPVRASNVSHEKHMAAVDDWDNRRRREAGRAELIFAKVRDGETGIAELNYDGTRTRFSDVDARR